MSDFGIKLIEHLRLVHFSMTVASVSLIAFVTIDRPGDYAIAFRDANAITDLVSNLRRTDWIEKSAMDAIEAFENVTGREFHELPPSIEFEVDFGTVRRKLTLPLIDKSFIFPAPQRTLVQAQVTEFKRIYTRVGPGGIESVEMLDYQLPGAAYDVRTLDDFRILWDLLYVTQEISAIEGTTDQVLVAHSAGSPIIPAYRYVDLGMHVDFGEWWERNNSSKIPIALKWMQISSDQENTWGPLLRFTSTEISLKPTAADMWSSNQYITNDNPDLLERSPYASVVNLDCKRIDETCVAVFVQLDTRSIRFAGQRYLIDNLRNMYGDNAPTWVEGPFESSFTQLTGLATHLFNLPLKDLSAYMQQQAQRASESVEFFGVSLPSANLRVWGSVLILILQLYYLVHIRRFVQAIRVSGINFLFPWIGVYPDQISKLIFWISSMLVPVVACVVLYQGIAIAVSLLLAIFTLEQLLLVREKVDQLNKA